MEPLVATNALSMNIIEMLNKLVTNMEDMSINEIEEKLELLLNDFNDQTPMLVHIYKNDVSCRESFINAYMFARDDKKPIIMTDDIIKIQTFIEQYSSTLTTINSYVATEYSVFLVDVNKKMEIYKHGMKYLFSEDVTLVKNLVSEIEQIEKRYEILCEDFWLNEQEKINMYFAKERYYIDIFTTQKSIENKFISLADILWKGYTFLPLTFKEKLKEKCITRSKELYTIVRQRNDRFINNVSDMRQQYIKLLKEITNVENTKAIMEFCSQSYNAVYDGREDSDTFRNEKNKIQIETSNMHLSKFIATEYSTYSWNIKDFFNNILKYAINIISFEPNYEYYTLRIINFISDNELHVLMNNISSKTLNFDANSATNSYIHNITKPIEIDIGDSNLLLAIHDEHYRNIQHYLTNARGVDPYIMYNYNSKEKHIVEYVLLNIDDYCMQHHALNFVKYHYANGEYTVALSTHAFNCVLTCIQNSHRLLTNTHCGSLELILKNIPHTNANTNINNFQDKKLLQQYSFKQTCMYVKLLLERSFSLA
jgi:hypothetical protein